MGRSVPQRLIGAIALAMLASPANATGEPAGAIDLNALGPRGIALESSPI